MSAAAFGNAKLAESPARQPTILVVEDHADTREMLHTLLEMWGCRVVEACNGLEAVEAASRERPQLILMDGRLPFLDGLQATRRIRENGLGDQVKIVALDSSGSPRYHADALAAGCNESLEKPFDFDWLQTYLFCSSILPLTPRGNGTIAQASRNTRYDTPSIAARVAR
jgi:CheY-like chemotaxis protein